MGSLIAPFDENGNLQTQTTSGDSLSNKSTKNKNTVDSDMFLTLLVAEMQNQDPLEPTSNTEWVSQYATFTQVQKMGEMAEAIDVLRANSLIGKEVIMRTTSQSTGEVNYIQGIVDFVEVENGKPLLVIDDQKYSISDLDTIVSAEYSAAYEKYSTFKGMIDSLPDVAFANATYENVIQGALDFYNSMDDYQKNYMKIYGSDQMDKFTEWKVELENLGVKFKDSSVAEEEEEKTTLDDILESFNTKMNAILDKLNLMAESKTEEDSGKKDDETGDKVNTETGDQTNTGAGDKVDTETGDQTNTGAGDKVDTETGDQTNTGTGDKVDTETGDQTNTGTGDKVDTETGDQTNTETGDKVDIGTGDQTNTETDGKVDTETGDQTGETETA